MLPINGLPIVELVRVCICIYIYRNMGLIYTSTESVKKHDRQMYYTHTGVRTHTYRCRERDAQIFVLDNYI